MSDAPILTLPFLGQRTYLHGTTLFETLIEPGASDLSFKINRLIPSNRVRIHETAPEGAKISAQLVFTGADGLHRTRLVTAEPASDPIDRAPFDEKAVTDLAEFEGERATLAAPSPVTPIKTLVALNKALLLRRFPPAKPGQWFFTRIDGDFYPAVTGQVVLTCRPTLSPNAMASDVTIDGRPMGRLIFSWAEAS